MSRPSSIPPRAPGLRPLVVRAIELGRGPPGLVQWLRGRRRMVAANSGAEAADSPDVQQLVRELARAVERIRPQAEYQTVLVGQQDTLVELTSPGTRV